MSTYSVYFSPTGGTKKVMDILAEHMGAEQEIDLSQPDTDYGVYCFGPADICLVGVPSFGGRVPEAALERLKQMHADGTRAVIAAVYGNRHYDDTLLELKKAMESCGFQIAAAVSAVAEHSIMHQFGAGRPDEQDQKELALFAENIRENLKLKEITREIRIPGNEPYREYNGVPFKPKADKKCKKCGICVNQCPVKAIPKDHPESVDEARCISCMRCVSVCPEHARDLNEAILLVALAKIKKACSSRKENELFI